MDLYEYILKHKYSHPGFTQNSLAKKVGLSAQNFSKIVRKKVIPSARVARKIEEVTDGEVCGWDIIKAAMDKRDSERLSKQQQKKGENHEGITIIGNGAMLGICPE